MDTQSVTCLLQYGFDRGTPSTLLLQYTAFGKLLNPTNRCVSACGKLGGDLCGEMHAG
jgi:hypothetical protein